MSVPQYQAEDGFFRTPGHRVRVLERLQDGPLPAGALRTVVEVKSSGPTQEQAVVRGFGKRQVEVGGPGAGRADRRWTGGRSAGGRSRRMMSPIINRARVRRPVAGALVLNGAVERQRWCSEEIPAASNHLEGAGGRPAMPGRRLHRSCREEAQR